MRIQGALAAALLLLAPPAVAGLDPYEPNDTFETATPIDFAANQVGQVVTLDAAIAISDADFFAFTNMVPGAEYEVALDNLLLGIGLYSDTGVLIDSVAFESEIAIVGVADGSGRLFVSVCGRAGQTSSDLDCSASGSSFGTGPYTLTVPEPGAPAAAAAALATLAALGRRRRG